MKEDDPIVNPTTQITLAHFEEAMSKARRSVPEVTRARNGIFKREKSPRRRLTIATITANHHHTTERHPEVRGLRQLDEAGHFRGHGLQF